MTEKQILYCWDRLVRAVERRAAMTDRQRKNLVTWIHDQGPDPELASAADKLLNGQLTAEEAARGYDAHRINGFDVAAYREKLGEVRSLSISVSDTLPTMKDAITGDLVETTPRGEGSTARRTIRKARLFLVHAEQARLKDREALEANIEAAITFGRSAVYHLYKQYAHMPVFRPWRKHILGPKLEADPLIHFLTKSRHLIVHEGPVGVRRVISVSMSASVHAYASGAADVQFVRAKPWYRRSPKIFWEDVRAAVMRPIRRWRDRRRELARRRARAARQSTTKVSEDFYFDDSQWSSRPALELLREYLDKLEQLVAEVEGKFGSGS